MWYETTLWQVESTNYISIKYPQSLLKSNYVIFNYFLVSLLVFSLKASPLYPMNLFLGIRKNWYVWPYSEWKEPYENWFAAFLFEFLYGMGMQLNRVLSSAFGTETGVSDMISMLAIITNLFHSQTLPAAAIFDYAFCWPIFHPPRFLIYKLLKYINSNLT